MPKLQKCITNNYSRHNLTSYLGPAEHKQFLYAAIKGDKIALELWIKKGVNINYANTHGETALFLVTGTGSLECAKLLVDNGADWSVTTKSKQSVLHNAAAAGNEMLLEFYRNLGLGKIDVESWDGSTELLVAARGGHNRILSYLIDKGADINYRDLNGLTALHYAVRHGHYESTMVLCMRGAKVNMLTYVDGERGECPLHSAMREQSTRGVSILIQHGAKITCCFSCRRGKPCSRVSPQILERVRTEIKLRKKSRSDRTLKRAATQIDFKELKGEKKLIIDTPSKSTSFLSKFFQDSFKRRKKIE